MPYTLKANVVWVEGTSLESKPSYEEGARDGHFLNEYDTGKQYLRRYGVWEDADIGLLLVKTTKNGPATSDANGLATISFPLPLANTNYSITFGLQDEGSPGNLGIPHFYDKAVDGFKVITRATAGGIPKANVTFDWFVTLHFNP